MTQYIGFYYKTIPSQKGNDKNHEIYKQIKKQALKTKPSFFVNKRKNVKFLTNSLQIGKDSVE